MRRRLTVRSYWLIPATVAGVILLLFAVVAASGVPFLVDPVPAMREAGWVAALIGVGLLLGDVALPVPSSAVMIAHGTLFGLLPGAGLSVLGGVGATMAGFAVGRRGRLVVERIATVAQRSRADRLLKRWGWFAIVLTRPVPVLAETVAVLAGTSPMRWSTAVLAGAAGVVVPASLYAAAGAAGGLSAGLGLAAVLVPHGRT